MGKVRIELNGAGVRELLKSPEIRAVCEEHANRALGRLGDGHEVKTVEWPSRVTVSIHAESEQAKRENLKNNTIMKALRG